MNSTNKLFTVLVERKLYLEDTVELERVYMVHASDETDAENQVMAHLIQNVPEVLSLNIQDNESSALATLCRIGCDADHLNSFEAFKASNSNAKDHFIDDKLNTQFLDQFRHVIDFDNLPFEDEWIIYGADQCNTGRVGNATQTNPDELSVLNKHVTIYPIGDEAYTVFQQISKEQLESNTSQYAQADITFITSEIEETKQIRLKLPKGVSSEQFSNLLMLYGIRSELEKNELQFEDLIKQLSHERDRIMIDGEASYCNLKIKPITHADYRALVDAATLDESHIKSLYHNLIERHEELMEIDNGVFISMKAHNPAFYKFFDRLMQSAMAEKPYTTQILI